MATLVTETVCSLDLPAVAVGCLVLCVERETRDVVTSLVVREG